MKENITFNSSQKIILVAFMITDRMEFFCMKVFQSYSFRAGHRQDFLGIKMDHERFCGLDCFTCRVLNAVDFLNTWGLIAIGID